MLYGSSPLMASLAFSVAAGAPASSKKTITCPFLKTGAQLNKKRATYEGQIFVDMGGNQLMLHNGAVRCGLISVWAEGWASSLGGSPALLLASGVFGFDIGAFEGSAPQSGNAGGRT
jgi:hypothetical protein